MEEVTAISGYRRSGGRAGIRNHTLVIPTVSCANGVVNRIWREVPEAVCVTHAHGCGRGGMRDLEILFRVLTGMLQNPNVGAAVLIGLGCEVSNVKALAPLLEGIGKPLTVLNVQDDGGSLRTAEKGIEAARHYLAELRKQERESISWRDLLVSIECGGSDAMSGVTANVVMGAVADWLVDRGATVMFGENTEMIGTAHVLARRAKDPEVAARITEMVDRAEERTRETMGELAGLVITPGNMDGGMSTIAEKSMGCIVKGGTREIGEVVDYAAAPAGKGLVLQDGPGYDTDSMAGFAAGGSQVMLFSTGRGTPAGFPTVPVIKVASNSRLYGAMEDDMDIDAGGLVEGESLDALKDEMIDLMIRVINGEPTKPEKNGMGVFTFMTVHPPF
ncbi:MAG: UxaA family hydrolase [Deltaproteobacteria bacterium]|nr:UxaA family hydrolase [Deltaproteobacteria bacterium]